MCLVLGENTCSYYPSLTSRSGAFRRAESGVDDMSKRTRFLIVHNVSAGRERHELVDQVRAALVSAGASVGIQVAHGLEAGRQLAADAARNGTIEAVVAAGGDSTIRGVAGGLVGTGVPLGIIPIGTGNVLAEELGLSRRPEAIAHYLLEGDPVPVSPGMADGELFLSMASAGFDVGVLDRLDLRVKRRIGKLAYVWPTLRQLWSRPRRFEVLVDGCAHRCTWLIASKVAHYAGSVVIAPRQKLTDPEFQCLIIDASSPAALASIIITAGLGWAERHPRIKFVKCRQVTVRAGQNIDFQLDGEPIGSSELNISMSRKAIAVIMPRPQ